MNAVNFIMPFEIDNEFYISRPMMTLNGWAWFIFDKDMKQVNDDKLFERFKQKFFSNGDNQT